MAKKKKMKKKKKVITLGWVVNGERRHARRQGELVLRSHMSINVFDARKCDNDADGGLEGV
jgi:hypothetical protein